jgi:hypothetical protein
MRASDGRVWIAGTDGFAAVVGNGSTQRLDYPRGAGSHRYSYDSSTYPAARTVELGGRIYLVTRHGEIRQLVGDEWEIVEPALVIGGEFNRQIDYAVATREGEMLLHVHSDRLLWVTPGVATPRAEERMPSYLEHVTLIGDEIVGVGWKDKTERRTLVRRVAKDDWQTLGELPKWAGVHAIGAIDDRLAVAGFYGIFLADRRGGLEFVSADALVEPHLPRPGRAPGLVVAGDELPVPQRIAAADPMTSDREPAFTSAISDAFPLARGRMALFVRAPISGFLLLGGGQASELRPCGLLYAPQAVFDAGEALWAVGSYGEILDVGRERCVEISPNLLPGD